MSDTPSRFRSRHATADGSPRRTELTPEEAARALCIAIQGKAVMGSFNATRFEERLAIADTGWRDEAGRNAVSFAIRHDSSFLAGLFEKFDLRLEYLLLAVEADRPEALAELLHERERKPVEQQGKTPLHVAAELNRPQCAKVLVEHGERPCRDTNGKFPLELAAEKLSVDTVRELTQRRALADVRVGSIARAIGAACAASDSRGQEGAAASVECVKLLLDAAKAIFHDKEHTAQERSMFAKRLGKPLAERMSAGQIAHARLLAPWVDMTFKHQGKSLAAHAVKHGTPAILAVLLENDPSPRDTAIKSGLLDKAVSAKEWAFVDVLAQLCPVEDLRQVLENAKKQGVQLLGATAALEARELSSIVKNGLGAAAKKSVAQSGTPLADEGAGETRVESNGFEKNRNDEAASRETAPKTSRGGNRRI